MLEHGFHTVIRMTQNARKIYQHTCYIQLHVPCVIYVIIYLFM